MTTYIAYSDFVRRQTPESRFAHFEGHEEVLIFLTEFYWDNRRESGAGVAVPVPPKNFWTSTIRVNEDTSLHVEFSKRQEHEEAHVGVSANGEKVPAEKVDIILYHKDTLEKYNERSTDADWEIISINAYPSDRESPMHPITMARNFLEKEGGTKVEYTPEEFAQSIWYWSQHTNVRPAREDKDERTT